MSGNGALTYEVRNLVIVGGGGVGKSCLTVQFVQNEFVDYYDPTIEDSYRKQCGIDGKVAMIDILGVYLCESKTYREDTAGQDEFSAMRDLYLRKGEGFLIVYSVTSTASLQEAKNFYQMILRVKDADSWPVVLVGNKSDLESQREVSTQEGQDLAKEWGAPFLESSARNAINVDEAFYELVRVLRRLEGGEKDPSAQVPTKIKKAKK